MNVRFVTPNQLMTLMTLFLIASSMLSNIGKYVGQNVWIVLGLSGLISIILFTLYYRISKLNQFRSLTDIFKACFGEKLGLVFIFIYAMNFALRSIIVGNALTDMAQETLMRGAEQKHVILMLLIAVIFGCIYGLKTMGRSSEFFFGIVLLCLIPFFSTAFTSGAFKYDNLTPILAKGISGIRLDIFRLSMFPFGEMLVFLMIYPFVPSQEKSQILKRGYFAILISTLLMIIIDSTCVAILGPDLTKNFNYPFYSAMQLAGLKGLLERLDPLATIIVVLSGYVKTIMYFYCSLLAFQALHRRLKYKWLLVIASISVYFLAPHIRLDKTKYLLRILPFRVLPILQVAIPILLWLISEYRHYKQKNSNKTKLEVGPAEPEGY